MLALRRPRAGLQATQARGWFPNPKNKIPIALVGIALAALVLGYWGFHLNYRDRGLSRDFWDKLYASFQLFALEFNTEPPIKWPLKVARLLAAATAFGAAATVALLLFRQQLAELWIRLRARGHIVICGLGPCGARLAHGLEEARRGRGDGVGIERRKVVAVEADEAGSAAVQACREAGITVLIGDARSEAVLDRARLEKARYVIVACGDDGINAEIAAQVRRLVQEPEQLAERKQAGLPLDCFVHLDDVELSWRLAEIAAADKDDPYAFHFFNPSSRAAAAMLLGDRALDIDPANRPDSPHMLVVGAHQMGRRLVLHAARCWRYLPTLDGARPRITVLDKDADQRVEYLRQRYPWLEGVCELAPCGLDVDADPSFDRGDFLENVRVAGRNSLPPPTSAYVCLDRDDRGLRAALTIHRHWPDRQVRIVVRTAARTGLATILEGLPAGGGPRAFGLVDRACTPRMLLNPHNELLAQILPAAQPQTPTPTEWDELSDDEREARRAQAEYLGRMLMDADYYIDRLTDRDVELVEFSDADLARMPQGHGISREMAREIPALLVRAELFALRGDAIEVLAEAIHKRYLKERLAAGEKLGATPALAHWEDLPEEYKESNRGQARGYETVLAAVGCEIASLVARVPGVVAFSRGEVETMAELEHERWCREKETAGWSCGPERSDEQRQHPDLVPWSELPDHRRELDRNTVRGIPQFLDRVGFAVAQKR